MSDEIKCDIKWNLLTIREWEERFSRIRRAGLLQSYDYARAVCAIQFQKARWGQIFLNGQEAGLVQLLEAGTPWNILHAVILDRGPLWFDGFGGPSDISAFFKEFNRQFPRRPGRRRRIIPEAETIKGAGLERLPSPGYQTVWLDLDKDTQTLRAALDKKWRNALSRAERSGIQIKWDENGQSLPFFLTRYQLDKTEKGYTGPSVKVLRALAKSFAPKGRLLIGRAFSSNAALEDGEIAAILILCHGRAATYQAGWTSQEGRDAAAHNLLLWQAVCRLKNKGYLDFDLGGISDETRGIKKFKEAMGGQKVTYAGQYL